MTSDNNDEGAVKKDLVLAMKKDSYRFPRGRLIGSEYSDVMLKITKIESAVLYPLSEDMKDQLDEHLAHKTLDNLSLENRQALIKALNTLVYVHICYKGKKILICDKKIPEKATTS